VASASGDRQRAARLLVRVDGGAFAARLLDACAAPGVRARVLGVLRWRRALDEALALRLKRPLARLDPEVRAVLRLGTFEILHLGVPRPVATDAMVRLTRAVGKSSAAGLVNAVLHRVAATPPDRSPDLTWSHPEWLWRRWRDAFGENEAKRAMAAAQMVAPAWVWFPDGDARIHAEAANAVLEAHPWCPDAWAAAEGTSAILSIVGAGRVVVQDPSSQLVARVAAAVVDGHGRALDACAAPGGKTAMLASLGSWSLLAAADLNPTRAARLRRRLDTDVANVVVVADAAFSPFAPGGWDLVLLDAPCSGTGTLRRHPELKWRLSPEAIGEASTRQRPMIGSAIELLAPSGVLVYATCSVEPEENEAHFEVLPSGVERVELEAHLPTELPRLSTAAGGIRILPHEHGDGFTIHCVRRTAGLHYA